MVYVISKNNEPLMPCSNAIARLLLKQGKAKVKQRQPFTIKLLYDTTTYTQDLTLGVDTGSSTIGAAVVNSSDEVIYMSKVIVRNDVTDNMTQRRSYRRSHRNRKTRYRKARFLNRKNSIKKDRFSPTMINKFNSHIKEIEYIKSILPITKLVLETGTFDTQLMKHEGESFNRHWGYQKGPNYGFENTKAMVKNRDNYTCQYCKGKHRDSKLEVHHIVFRSNNGSDEQENLITLCHTCHQAVHDGVISLNRIGKIKGQLKYATQMNSIRVQLLKHYPEAIETFGFITKANRLEMNLPKDHNYDACVIASGGNQVTFQTNVVYVKKSVAKGDYQLTKGVRSEQKIPKGKICGFKKFDKVRYLGREYFIKGRMSTGYGILMDIDGNTQKFDNPKTVKLVKCKRLNARKTLMVAPIHPTS